MKIKRILFICIIALILTFFSFLISGYLNEGTFGFPLKVYWINDYAKACRGDTGLSCLQAQSEEVSYINLLVNFALWYVVVMLVDFLLQKKSKK